MRDIIDVSVHCMGSPREEKDVFVHGVDPALEGANGALAAAEVAKALGLAGIVLASVNIFGGFMVTRRMLEMFKKKDKKAGAK